MTRDEWGRKRVLLEEAVAIAVQTHLLSAGEWATLFREEGFTSVACEPIPDPSPLLETYSGRRFRDAAQLRAFKAEGALLVHGTKP